MNSFESLADWQIFRQSETHTLGFVPTMGALHQGHLSLIRRSLKETQKTVVSIFVNPTQFSDSNDLQNYPRPLAKDIELLRREGVNYLLLPTYPELYADGYRFQVHESATSKILCGQHRPGHFT